MKIIAYVALLYGKDYLAASIQSIIDYVGEYHVLYSPHGSHGTQINTPCPETREELRAIAQTAAGSKLRWHDGNWRQENEQRESIYQYAPDADAILIVDADEIWHPRTWAMVEAEMGYKGRGIRIPFIHFWRSFHKAIVRDPAAPTRVIFPKAVRPDWILDFSLEQAINHMGYAQRSEIVGYKMKIHGHKHQLKPNWFETVFLDKNRTTDLHPVGSEWWNVETVDPLDYMPEFMASHPYFKMDWIE